MRFQIRRLSGTAGLILVALLLAPLGVTQAAFSWQIETIDSEGDVGFDPSLAIDGAGRAHISYHDDANEDLKYARFDGMHWQIETVDSEGDVGENISLALDSQDRPHISYTDMTNRDLKYARYTGTTWQIETVDTEASVGWYTSLAVDSNGQPHISYHDATNTALKYAYYTGLIWEIETVDSVGSVGIATSLALDGSDRPHIGYRDITNDVVKYAYFTGTNWTIETVASAGEFAFATSLALDNNGRPHISYDDFTDRNLKYAYSTGTVWQIETVDNLEGIGGHPSLTIDSADRPHISYSHSTKGDLKYAYSTGETWEIETVDSAGRVGYTASLALDATGVPHISYHDATNSDLKYAHAINLPAIAEAGGPYSGAESGPTTLDGTVSDPENDELTSTWTYTVDNADPDVTCSFGNSSEVDTTITCTDDGTFTLTLTTDDGNNPPVSATTNLTISNVAPMITEISTVRSGSQVTVTVIASDPAGVNDPLSYAFDCNNDTSYEVGPQTSNSASCDFGTTVEGTFQIGVQVSDDDGGITTGTANVTIPTSLCANDHTDVLRYSTTCWSHETAITLPDDGPATACASIHNGLLRAPANGNCQQHEISYELPEDGPLSICVSSYTQTMRTVNDISLCAGHEFGRVIAATEVGATQPPRVR